MAERKAATKSKKTSAKRTTGTTYTGFSAEERAAMKERARELKAEERWKKDRAAGEKAVLDKIATMPGPDRTMAKRLHAIIKATAPDLSPKTWYGMPAYVNQDGKVVCFFQSGINTNRGTRRSVSRTRRTSTKAPCGRPPSR